MAMPVHVAQGDEGPAPGDALAGVVRPVLHHLFRRDVERHAHAGARLRSPQRGRGMRS